MHIPQLHSARTRSEVAPHEEHRSRWKLRLFPWPVRHRTPTADSSKSAKSVPPEFSATALLQDCELHDELLAEARRRLEALESDPETDELTLVMACHEIFRRKRKIAESFENSRRCV